jgi:hypothetical protein
MAWQRPGGRAAALGSPGAAVALGGTFKLIADFGDEQLKIA